jgi:hypothetical protein
MLLNRRAPGIDSRPVESVAGLEHLRAENVAVLRWLAQNRVEYVVVGPIARAIRGDTSAGGPVAIVPAPYGRNLDRLCRALSSAHARRIVEGGARAEDGEPETTPIKMTPEKLTSAARWKLRVGVHDLDVEGRGPGLPRYQELIYEAGTFDLEPGLKVQVGSLEDVEHYEHVRRTGFAPEIRISRKEREPTP